MVNILTEVKKIMEVKGDHYEKIIQTVNLITVAFIVRPLPRPQGA